jgi:hypothetical protein
MEVANNIDNVEYLRSSMPVKEQSKYSDSDLAQLQNNVFIQNLVVTGLRSNIIELNVDQKTLTGTRLSMFRDAFDRLPDYFKDMFINYEVLRTKMSYRRGSLQQVIGIEFYEGEISEIFNKIHGAVKRGNLDGFIPPKYSKTYTFENDIKQKLFDYLGMQEEFSRYVPYNRMNAAQGPKYINNTGEQRTDLFGNTIYGKTVFYIKNDNGQYEEAYLNANKTSASLTHQTISNAKSFRPTIEEIISLTTSSDKRATHLGNVSTVERGDFLMANKYLVKVENRSNSIPFDFKNPVFAVEGLIH